MAMFQAMGGTAACRQLSEAFYARVKRDPVLRPLFPGKTLHCAIEEFSAWLVQFLEGPSEDTQRRWWLSLRESHLRKKIGAKEREAWLRNMSETLDEIPMEEPVRAALRGLFARSSAYLVNIGAAPAVATANGHEEIARRWDVQLTLDEAVAAIRSGDAPRAIALSRSAASKRSVFAFLLELMMLSGQKALLDYVRQELPADPSLAHERYSGHTLLHAACGAGNLPMAELLLRFGADPNGGGHPPLYSVGNQCLRGGAPLVRLLVESGAKVDARERPKLCTALHMAARRGNVDVAGALLDCGADLEARDSLGETPLRRAVNCNKTEVAAILVARGADIHSMGSKGLTPLAAARSIAMKQVLRPAI